MVRHRLAGIVSRKGRGWLDSVSVRTEGSSCLLRKVKVATVKGVLDCPDGVGPSGRSVILYNMAADAPMEIASST